MLMGDDAVPRHLTREDEWGGEVMRRLEDGWCVALDRDTLLCKIYAQRPAVCREYEMGGHACAEERAHLAPPPAAARPLVTQSAVAGLSVSNRAPSSLALLPEGEG